MGDLPDIELEGFGWRPDLGEHGHLVLTLLFQADTDEHPAGATLFVFTLPFNRYGATVLAAAEKELRAALAAADDEADLSRERIVAVAERCGLSCVGMLSLPDDVRGWDYAGMVYFND